MREDFPAPFGPTTATHSPGVTSRDTVRSDGVRDLGFPDFFRIQLAFLKLVAIPILLLPVVPVQFKEWAYAGVGLYLLTAIIAHYAHGDPIILNVLNVVFVILLVTSNLYLPR